MAKRGAKVVEATSQRIVVRIGNDRNVYEPARFRRTNQATCLSHTPLVSPGQETVGGQTLADVSGTQGGEPAPGKDVLVARLYAVLRSELRGLDMHLARTRAQRHFRAQAEGRKPAVGRPAALAGAGDSLDGTLERIVAGLAPIHPSGESTTMKAKPCGDC